MQHIIEWVNNHKAKGHDATVTVVAAPGTGNGSYCFTCREHGPDTARMLTIEDVK